MVDGREPPLGWVRAIVTAAIIAAVAIAALVYAPNAVLTKVHSLNRGNLVGLACGMFFVALFALTWALRGLQRRNVM
jgi:hypothetical protein